MDVTSGRCRKVTTCLFAKGFLLGPRENILLQRISQIQFLSLMSICNMQMWKRVKNITEDVALQLRSLLAQGVAPHVVQCFGPSRALWGKWDCTAPVKMLKMCFLKLAIKGRTTGMSVTETVKIWTYKKNMHACNTSSSAIEDIWFVSAIYCVQEQVINFILLLNILITIICSLSFNYQYFYAHINSYSNLDLVQNITQ